MTEVEYYRIGVPPGARLQALMRVKDGWLVWIGISNQSDRPSTWLGTYLYLHDDGQVERVTVMEDGSEDVWTIRPADHDGNDSTGSKGG